MNQTASHDVNRKTVQKYILLQIPGATMVGFLLAFFYYMGTLSGAMALLLFAGWCVKDAVMFRFVRKAYEPGPPHGTEALIGRPAVVVEALQPEGRVRVGPEHWKARAETEGTHIAEGTPVRVVSVDGYTVIVAGFDRLRE